METKYIIHPETGEVQESVNFTMFKNWKGTKFIELTATEVITEEKMQLIGKLENGKEVILNLSIEDYFEGKSFNLNK